MNRYNSLEFSVRASMIIGYLAKLLGIVAVFSIVPFFVFLFSKVYLVALSYAGIIISLLSLFLCFRKFPQKKFLQRNEALIIISFTFIITSLIMSLPMMVSGLKPTDAIFEAVSGITTTGLTTIANIEDMPLPFLFARAWLQWLGGLGIVMLALILLIRPAFAAKHLLVSELEMNNLVGGTKAHARKIFQVYITLTLIGIIALLFGGASISDAIIHSLTSVSTGGFSNYNASIQSLPVAQIIIINILCFLGAISFHVYYRSTFLTFDPKRIGESQFLSLTLAIVVISSAISLLSVNQSEPDSLLSSITLAISAQTTAGFSMTDVSSISNGTMLMLCFAMFIGGGIGSTAGGIKIGRFLYFLKSLWMILITASSSSRSIIYQGKKEESFDRAQDIIAIIVSFSLVLFISWLIFLIYGHDPIKSLFEVTSALGTVGLSTGITSSELNTPLKFILCLDMLMGRLEIIAIILLFYPRTWIGKRRHE